MGTAVKLRDGYLAFAWESVTRWFKIQKNKMKILNTNITFVCALLTQPLAIIKTISCSNSNKCSVQC